MTLKWVCKATCSTRQLTIRFPWSNALEAGGFRPQFVTGILEADWLTVPREGERSCSLACEESHVSVRALK